MKRQDRVNDTHSSAAITVPAANAFEGLYHRSESLAVELESIEVHDESCRLGRQVLVTVTPNSAGGLDIWVSEVLFPTVFRPPCSASMRSLRPESVGGRPLRQRRLVVDPSDFREDRSLTLALPSSCVIARGTLRDPWAESNLVDVQTWRDCWSVGLCRTARKLYVRAVMITRGEEAVPRRIGGLIAGLMWT
eukprot:936876-Prorocentrum_minimum.AAC.1